MKAAIANIAYLVTFPAFQCIYVIQIFGLFFIELNKDI